MYTCSSTQYAVRSTSVPCRSDRYYMTSLALPMYKVPAVLICTCRYKVQVHKACYSYPIFLYHLYLYLYVYLYLCMHQVLPRYTKSSISTSTAPSEQSQPIPTTLLEAQTRNRVCRFRPGWAGVGFGGGFGGWLFTCTRTCTCTCRKQKSRTDVCYTDGRWE